MKKILVVMKPVFADIIKMSVWILAASILFCTCIEHGWIYTGQIEVTHDMFRQVFGYFIWIMPVVITIRSLCGRYHVETETKVETCIIPPPESYTSAYPVNSKYYIFRFVK